ncbi:hypothetical protein B0A49_11474, partial [Cryomyces minteri]
MGSYTFKWGHPANEVFVTASASNPMAVAYERGTFDDWAKSEKLERKGDHFEKTVQLAVANEKIYYKFVVDGNWTTDHTAPSERDGAYNVNNILLPEEIQHSSPTAHTMSSAAPQS